ncbi:MAG TPA: zinc-finger domain-containing protein [Casimicrobiaceae bacterium]|nr:zinc-finger domain-containing protein [Casimicrobiaceae bacterium]
MSEKLEDARMVVVKPADLPIYCPNPAMPLWSSHPRVFLDVIDTGEAMCPYCGTRYRLEGGPQRGARH